MKVELLVCEMMERAAAGDSISVNALAIQVGDKIAILRDRIDELGGYHDDV